MKCEKARQLIHASLDEVIGRPDRLALDAHLSDCASCRRELQTTRATLDLLAGVPRHHLSDEFDRKLNARLAELGSRRSPREIWNRLWQMNGWRLRPALLPLAMLVVALTTYSLMPEPAETPRAASEPSLYVTQLLREYEAGARWRELPEAAVDFNLDVASTATAAHDLLQ
jgi:anti-sigma factor RsiW